MPVCQSYHKAMKYSPEDFGSEVAAPSGYYQPLEQGLLEYEGKRVLYTLGSACIEASCCGTASWNYLRVEGFVVEDRAADRPADGQPLEIDTVEGSGDKKAIGLLLLEKHPGVRIEFR
jgi:hypothetical protein